MLYKPILIQLTAFAASRSESIVRSRAMWCELIHRKARRLITKRKIRFPNSFCYLLFFLYTTGIGSLSELNFDLQINASAIKKMRFNCLHYFALTINYFCWNFNFFEYNDEIFVGNNFHFYFKGRIRCSAA